MKELHFWHLDNLLDTVKALAKEKYKFTIETNHNGTWTITLDEEQLTHTNVF
jgi:hypothetical protein